MYTFKTGDIFCEVSYDRMNFIVEHKKVNNDPKSKNFGKTVIDGTRSYFSTGKAMASNISDMVLGKAIDNNVENLGEHLDKVLVEFMEHVKDTTK